MNRSTFESIKKYMPIILIGILTIIFIVLLILTRDDKFIKNVKEFIRTDTKVLYITNKKNYNKYPIKILDKYEINYKYIDSSKLSSFEKSKIENIINNRDLSNIIVIFEDGKIKDALLRYEGEEELNNFLIKNEIIPSIIGDISGIKNKLSVSLESDFLLLYLPYVYDENIEYEEGLLKDISKQYNIEYKKIDIYLLSKSQQQKINSLLNISEVKDQIILFIKNKEIQGSIRGYNKKSEYVNKLFEYGFIEEIYNYITEIGYEDFDRKINSDDKNIFLITKDTCKYCKETMILLNQVSSNNNLDIYYINIVNMDSDLSIKVENKIKSIGFSDGFSTPLLIITEKDKIIDYSIGVSTIDFYEEMFKENGLIK